MKARKISPDEDLHRLVEEINGASWDEANEMTRYDVEGLQAYLERQDTVFIACHEDPDDGGALLGIASSRIEIKPYDKELWLYVDEVDVCADQRKKGAGKLIMQTLMAIAKEEGCGELWLGTEVDNVPANALYRSLDPADASTFVGYTFATSD